MNINKLFQYRVHEQPKLFHFKDLSSKFWLCLLLFGFVFVCLVCYIVRSPAKSSAFDFKRLEDCLKTAGVDNNDIIHRSNETRYTEINWQWNTVNGYLEPMAYVIASNALDVQKAVVCCKLLKVRIVARSGGHSIMKSGFGDTNTLVIDLSRLNKISINPNQMISEIGAGARAALISYTLWRKGGFMIPVGICPTVGLGGFALGGGYGYYTRLLGLASDNVLEFEMVDAKGRLLIINNRTNKDLFWALRGGGGGSFGIVTKLKLKMYSAPKFVAYGIYDYSFNDFKQFYEAWQSFIISDQPNNISVLARMHDNRIELEIFKFYMDNNENMSDDFGDVLNSFSFPRPEITSTRLLPYQDFMLTTAQSYSTNTLLYPFQIANITKHTSVGLTKIKSIYVDKTLDKDEISKIQVLFRAYTNFSSITMEINTGAINNFTSSETAFIHRGKNLYMIHLDIFGNGYDEITLKAIASMNTFYEKSKLILNHRESYQNYLDQDMPDFLDRYYGANLKKLILVKKRTDPENVFHHPHSIPTSYV